MNKELTPLEALEEIKYQVGSIRACSHDIPPQITTFLVRETNWFSIIETALKALEIIKKYYKFEENQFYPFKRKNLLEMETQEEYDLLKEVLL